MKDQPQDDLAVLKKEVVAHFGVVLDIDTVIADSIPVSRSAEATLVLTKKKKQLYLYITSQSQLLLSDIQKIVGRMGLQAEVYLPPKGRPHYFDEVGTKKFREIFPGRTNITPQDIHFYRTLAPYHPALVLISEVKAGLIYQYDSDSKGEWRPSVRFTYRRIRTI